MLSGIVALSVVIFCVSISINHFRSKKLRKISNKPLPAITDQTVSRSIRGSGPRNPTIRTIAPAPCPRRSSEISLRAPNRKLFRSPPCKLFSASSSTRAYPDAEIPNRLFAAADQLAALRSSLADWQDQGPWHEQIRSEALAFVDSGEFDSACEVLRHGREAGWTFSHVRHDLEEAEFYAREAMIDHLQLRYCAAAETYAAAAALVAEGGGKECLALFDRAGPRTLRRRPRIRHARIICSAPSRFTIAPSDLPDGSNRRSIGPPQSIISAMRFCCLANATRTPGCCRESVEAYLAALEEWTRARAPREWAKAQNNLGHALQLLGEQEDDKERLRQAAEAYRAALAACSRDAAPFDWGRAYNRLGDTLAVLGVEEGDSERLKEAIEAYREALNGVDRELAPLDWAKDPKQSRQGA